MHWRTHLQASILGAVAGAHLVRCLAPAYGIPAWETQVTDGGLTEDLGKSMKVDMVVVLPLVDLPSYMYRYVYIHTII